MTAWKCDKRQKGKRDSMKEAYCLWHDKWLKDVAEWQQEQCEEAGMKCEDCQFITTKDIEEGE